MNQQPDDVMRRYLLGLASEVECEAVERGYLTDIREYECLGSAEDDLIEDYLDGCLDPQEKREFEHHFMTAAKRREQLAFARALRALVLRAPVEGRKESSRARILRWLRMPTFGGMEWATGVALVVAVIGCGLLFLQNRQLSAGYSLARAEKQELANQNEDIRRKLQASVQSPSSPLPLVTHDLQMINVVLSPGLTRSAGAPVRISIPPPAHLAKFKLELSTGNYHLYRALLRLSEGEELLSQNNLRPSSGQDLTLLIPTDLLRSGDYQIVLAGKTADGQYEPAATYSFRIARK